MTIALTLASPSALGAQTVGDRALGAGVKCLLNRACLRNAKADAIAAQALVSAMFRDRKPLEGAAPRFTEAAALYHRNGDHGKELLALLSASSAYQYLNRPDSAFALLERARSEVAVARLRADSARALEATVEHYTGELYRYLGRADSALFYLRRGVGYIRHWLETRSIDLAVPTGENATLASIGDVFLDASRPDSAVDYFRRALVALRTEPPPRTVVEEEGEVEGQAFDQSQIESRYWVGLANGYAQLGAPDSALSYFRQALARARPKRGRDWGGRDRWSDRRVVLAALEGIGSVHAARGQQDSAIASFVETIELSRKLEDRATEARVLHRLGRAYHRQQPVPDLLRAVAYYDTSAALLAALGEHTGGDVNLLAFIEQQLSLVEDWTLAWLARAPEVGEEASALASLAAAERGKAQGLLRLLRGGAPPAAAGADLAAQGRALARVVSDSTSAALVYLVTSDTLVTWLLLPGARVTVARQPISRDSLGRLVNAVRTEMGTADVVVAMAGRGGDTLALRGLGIAAGLSGRSRAAAVAARLVFPASLSAPLAAGTELLTVPSGVLATLPLAALPVDTSGTTLGARFPLRSAPSLAVAAQADARPVTARDSAARPVLRDALIVGDPLMPSAPGVEGGRVALPPLPGAKQEAESIARQVGAAPIVGAAATEAEVRRRLVGAPLVHLATHGFAFGSEVRARDSYVALSPGESHDGLLTVGELLDDEGLRLSAELVVLSACQTGLGDLKQAEGTVGLQRAFLARGARSVLVSLWSVSDEATRLLMERFYAHWLDDTDRPSKTEALRRAQADVRGTKAFEHPRYWAAFQLVGAR